jgi:hypothetical protein
MEVFDEVSKDAEAIDLMRIWLLKQKQTQDWKTSKATADACYALLLLGSDAIFQPSSVQIKLGNVLVDTQKDKELKTEAGTGYFKKTWSNTEIEKDMGSVEIKKESPGIAWGALYWQYFQNLENVAPHKTALSISKTLFVERIADQGPVIVPITNQTNLKKGDKLIIRISIKTDRDMDYVHLKDMRASGLEPLNTISQSKYQDGISYYESTKDAATHFFIPHLYKGTYVFEYPLRVSFSGTFSNGLASIQSMYAPEFSSFSNSISLKFE